MSLNTTLKCSRVGHEGLALSLIAQELRGYANEFALQATALVTEVGSVTKIAGALTADEDANAAPAIADVMQAMQTSLGTLRHVGQTLGDALAELDRDIDRVVALLDETVQDLAAHDDIGQALRLAACRLDAQSPPGTAVDEDLTPHVEQMLALMAGGYTMANERLIHDRVLGRTSAAAPVTLASNELEDMLF